MAPYNPSLGILVQVADREIRGRDEEAGKEIKPKLALRFSVIYTSIY